MKQIITLLMVAGIMMLGACKGKNTADENILTTNFELPKLEEPIAMPETEEHAEIEWGGRPYVVQIRRESVDSLPMVANDYGQKYIDNRVQVYIATGDGTPFFRRSFTKASFRSQLDKDFWRNGLLTGIHYLRAEGGTVDFTVAISHPEMSDGDDIPLLLSVDRQGGVSVKIEEELLDVFADEQE